MSDEFFVLEYPADNSKGYCLLDTLDGFEDDWAVGAGKSLADNPPGQLTMSMSEDEPRRTVLPDYVQNTYSLLIISPRLRSFFEAQQVSNVEYYPVQIKNHKGKVASSEYFVAHLINHVDCIDVDASEVTWTNEGLETQRILVMSQLELDPARVPKDRTLFFPRYYSEIPVLRSELAEAMNREGFTNVDIVPVAQHAC